MGIVYDRAEWLLVRPVKLPTEETRLGDELLIDVTALPDSGRGAMIDTVRLWELGVKSGVSWRTWIRLAYLWDNAKGRNGGYRIYATRPEVLRGPGGVVLDARGQSVVKSNGHPVTDWSDDRAVRTGKKERNPQAGKVPLLDTRELAHLGYDDAEVAATVLRDRANITRKWLRDMEATGAVVLEWKGEGVRVLEPWPGDNAGEAQCIDGRIVPPMVVTDAS